MRTLMWWCRGPRPPDSNSDQNQRQPIGSDNKTYYYAATLVELGCLQVLSLNILWLVTLPSRFAPGCKVWLQCHQEFQIKA
ncbi:uncharacterized protein SPPG_09412 [Spizellomyces punctatus DAOM BR117]|uniref:Uncharacterized protein n=1 Tax=Spizellomyces punctatus (strain DAOM BR117) TaxID=645134 RepID=A0A0L0H8J8_SPIPD|nr:uncharacterized protein SPPG_09412 [Spizellomyces punctatus DAOM BR117]KNC97860.1 hypothetical protein SPPG_09412 [Spizellomyces punctatus DAOM BR117]|eukprot:XP_016605900.1 hypothetical protein SPPG_09412 [Spizellomyces punctatus DAOM BR117]